MKGKLTKITNIYTLLDKNDRMIASDDLDMQKDYEIGKLSKQNCDEIFGVVDVEKLTEEYGSKFAHSYDPEDFIEGFNKAMELNKHKVFTEEDMRKAYFDGYNDKEENKFFNPSKSIQQPTEIEVEIEMEEISSTYLVTIGEVKTTKLEPKLDSSGKLILKKI